MNHTLMTLTDEGSLWVFKDRSCHIKTTSYPMLPNGLYGWNHTPNGVTASHVFELVKDKGFSNKVVIQGLLDRYLHLPNFRIGRFEKMPLVIGFIGSRGSGKTIGAVKTIITDWLLRGKNVWSNVPISVTVVYGNISHTFQAQPLDRLAMLNMEGSESYSDGCVFVDEINMEGGEAMRSMSGANIQFSYALQQLRKRNLSCLWTCQGWEWVDNRMRWQTDYAVSCRDASIGHDHMKIGAYSDWHVYDLSGLSGRFSFEFKLQHKYVSDFEVWKGRVWNEPFFGTYDTNLVQGQSDYIKDFKEAKKYQILKPLQLPEGKVDPIDQLVADIKSCSMLRFDSEQLWKDNNLENDKTAQSRIGKAFKAAGYIRRQGTGGKYFYDLKSAKPAQAAIDG